MEEKQRMIQEELEKKRELVKEIEKERDYIVEGKEKIIQKKTNDYYEQMQVRFNLIS